MKKIATEKGQMASERKIKIALGKVGLDGHDRGVRVIASWLRDAGVEVVYAGRFLTPEQMVNSAIQEDVDVMGISMLGADHLYMVTKILEVMRKNNLDIPLVVGGIIPKGDMPRLKEMGVSEVFPSGASVEEIVEFIRRLGAASEPLPVSR